VSFISTPNIKATRRLSHFFTAHNQRDTWKSRMCGGGIMKEKGETTIIPCENHVVPLHTQLKQREGLSPLWPYIFSLSALAIQPADQ